MQAETSTHFHLAGRTKGNGNGVDLILWNYIKQRPPEVTLLLLDGGDWGANSFCVPQNPPASGIYVKKSGFCSHTDTSGWAWAIGQVWELRWKWEPALGWSLCTETSLNISFHHGSVRACGKASSWSILLWIQMLWTLFLFRSVLHRIHSLKRWWFTLQALLSVLNSYTTCSEWCGLYCSLCGARWVEDQN